MAKKAAKATGASEPKSTKTEKKGVTPAEKRRAAKVAKKVDRMDKKIAKVQGRIDKLMAKKSKMEKKRDTVK